MMLDQLSQHTEDIDVNQVIKTVMKFQVRQQGVSSQARRPVEYSEFLNILTVVRTSMKYNGLDRFRGSILTLHWYLIARVDDMMKLQLSNFSYNPQHTFTLMYQMRWSNNITEERETPQQLVVGSMDERLCSLLNLAVYFEIHSMKKDFDEFICVMVWMVIVLCADF